MIEVIQIMTSRRTESSAGDRNFHHRRGASRAYYLLPVFWTMLSVVGIVAYVEFQSQRADRAFVDRAVSIGSHFAELDHGVKSVLEGFSAMLQVMDDKDPADRLMLARYVRQMQEVYPQVYAMSVIERVSRRQLAAFERRQSAILARPFRVRAFGFGASRTWQPPAHKDDYYVTTVMEPETRQTGRVLGLDIESSHAQAAALREAIRMHRSAVSRPFLSVSGAWAYMMIRPVVGHPNRFARIVIRCDTLGRLPWLRDLRDMSVVIRHDGFSPDDPKGRLYRHIEAPAGDLATMLLPVFGWQRDTSESGDDPFVVDVYKQMRWGDLDPPVLDGILLIQALVLLLLVRMAREHFDHDRERCRHERHLLHLASHDGLTGLPNRGLLLDRLDQAILRAKRNASGIGLLFMDLDRFKRVNDSYGHDAGDRFLMIVADALRQAVRAQDTVARLSGDEFVVLLEPMEGRDEAERVARKVKETVMESICTGYRELGVGVSIGIAMYPDDGNDAHGLLRYADSHMYGIKRGCRPAIPRP